MRATRMISFYRRHISITLHILYSFTTAKLVYFNRTIKIFCKKNCFKLTNLSNFST